MVNKQELQEQAALEKLFKAQAGSGGNYVQAGDHVLEVNQIIFKVGYKGTSIIAEWTVLSTNHSDPDYILDERSTRMYEGQRCASVFKIDNDAHMSCLKQLAEVLFEIGGVKKTFNAADDQEKQEMLRMLWSEQRDEKGAVVSPAGQTFQGVQVRCEASGRTSQKGNYYTKEFYSVPE